ncbi:MAG: DUF1425 domain-containing protein [Phycisphaerales bacterium]|jgi:uncharacterized protein YcfL
MNLTHTATLLSCAACLALAGCNTANTTRPMGPARADGTVPYEQIVTNGWLKYKANIVGVREGTVNGDMKRVAVDVYSDQLTSQRFSYRFDWFDASGMPVQSATSSLTSVTIKPKETITLTSVSPAPAASQWRLTFLDQQQR